MNYILIANWNFNILQISSWIIIKEFWLKGGTISKFKDYALFITLLSYIPLWIYLTKKAIKIKYLKLLLKPFEHYNDMIIKKHSKDSKRIILKNLGKKSSEDEQLEANLSDSNSNISIQEADKIRDIIADKINSAKNS